MRPVEDVLVAKLTLTGDPDWLAADEHGLWVFRQSGEFTLVDPTTNEVAGTVSVGDTTSAGYRGLLRLRVDLQGG